MKKKITNAYAIAKGNKIMMKSISVLRRDTISYLRAGFTNTEWRMIGFSPKEAAKTIGCRIVKVKVVLRDLEKV